MKKSFSKRPSQARSHRIRKLLGLENKTVSHKAVAWATIAGLFVLMALCLWLGGVLLDLLR